MTLFHDKKPQQTRSRGKLYQYNEDHIWKCHSKYHPQCWNTAVFLRSRTRQGCLFSPLLINTVLDISISHSVVSDSFNPMDYSPPDSSVHGIVQARILERIAIPFSRGSSWPWDRIWVSYIAGGFFTIWTSKEAV